MHGAGRVLVAEITSTAPPWSVTRFAQASAYADFPSPPTPADERQRPDRDARASKKLDTLDRDLDDRPPLERPLPLPGTWLRRRLLLLAAAGGPTRVQDTSRLDTRLLRLGRMREHPPFGAPELLADELLVERRPTLRRVEREQPLQRLRFACSAAEQLAPRQKIAMSRCPSGIGSPVSKHRRVSARVWPPSSTSWS